MSGRGKLYSADNYKQKICLHFFAGAVIIKFPYRVKAFGPDTVSIAGRERCKHTKGSSL